MRNPHPYRLFKDTTGPNSCSKFGVGNGPTGFDMLYPPLQGPSRGEVWTVGKGSPLYTVFLTSTWLLRMGYGTGTFHYQEMSLCNHG